jgi:uncharacterized membrane protein YfcA
VIFSGIVPDMVSAFENAAQSLVALSWLSLSIMLAGLMLASLARGYSGFGFSAVLISSWSLVVSPAAVIPVALVLEVTASFLQAFSVWSHIPWRRVVFLLLGAALGTPFGVSILAFAPPETVKLSLAIFVLISALLLFQGWKLRKRANAAGTVTVGIASGIANGAVGMGGLPVALFLTADGDSPAKIRAAVTAYFFLLDVMGLISLAQVHLVTIETVTTAVLAFPILVIGMALGTRHFLGATPEGFRRVTLLMLIGIALLGIGRHLWL